MRGKCRGREHALDVLEKLHVDGHHVFKVAVNRAVFNHPDFAVFLNDLGFISPTFSLIRTDTSCLPLRMSSRASITQFGHSESVVRGQPRVGFVFSHDFKSGLSDHFGVKEGFGRYLLTI